MSRCRLRISFLGHRRQQLTRLDQSNPACRRDYEDLAFGRSRPSRIATVALLSSTVPVLESSKCWRPSSKVYSQASRTNSTAVSCCSSMPMRNKIGWPSAGRKALMASRIRTTREQQHSMASRPLRFRAQQEREAKDALPRSRQRLSGTGKSAQSIGPLRGLRLKPPSQIFASSG